MFKVSTPQPWEWNKQAFHSQGRPWGLEMDGCLREFRG